MTRRTVDIPAREGATTTLPTALKFAPRVDELVVDLRALEFADPLFCVRVRSIIDWRAEQGYETLIRPPVGPNVGRYLQRMRLAEDLPDGCRCVLPPVREHDRGDVLLPITRLATAEEADRLDALLDDLFEAHFTGGIAPLAGVFQRAMAEMVDNAVTHGRNSCGTYVAAQRYRDTRCVLSIADLGVGVPAHLREALGGLDGDPDHRVIRHAMTERVTSTGNPHRGFGYHHVIAEATDNHVPGMHLEVWSAAGTTSTHVRGGRISATRDRRVRPTPGTFVRVELSTA